MHLDYVVIYYVFLTLTFTVFILCTYECTKQMIAKYCLSMTVNNDLTMYLDGVT